MTNSWMRWCRLCARDDPDNTHINIVLAEDEELPLCVTINLYFSVDINFYDNLPSMICYDCYKLIRTTMHLSHRASRVSAMFTELLHESVKEDDLKKIKAKFHVDADFQIFSLSENVEELVEEYLDEIPGKDPTEHEDSMPDKDIKMEEDELQNYDGFSSSEDSSRDDPDESVDKTEEIKKEDKTKNDEDEKMKEYYCPGCQKGFRRFHNYRRHMDVDHNITVIDWSEEEKTFNCRFCDKKLKSRHCLKHHEDTHDMTKYICVVCGQQLNTQQTLRNHMVVHSDAKKHKCEHCGRRYKRSKALKAHLVIHSGMKPYKCNFCSKSYASAPNSRSHMRKKHAKQLAEQDLAKSGVIVPKSEEETEDYNV